jgi:hypothetical protein
MLKLPNNWKSQRKNQTNNLLETPKMLPTKPRKRVGPEFIIYSTKDKI